MGGTVSVGRHLPVGGRAEIRPLEIPRLGIERDRVRVALRNTGQRAFQIGEDVLAAPAAGHDGERRENEFDGLQREERVAGREEVGDSALAERGIDDVAVNVRCADDGAVAEACFSRRHTTQNIGGDEIGGFHRVEGFDKTQGIVRGAVPRCKRVIVRTEQARRDKFQYCRAASPPPGEHGLTDGDRQGAGKARQPLLRVQGVRRRDLFCRVLGQTQGKRYICLREQCREDGILLFRETGESVYVDFITVERAVACEHFREPVEPVGTARVCLAAQIAVGGGDECVVGEFVLQRGVGDVPCGGVQHRGIQPRGAELCHDPAHAFDRADVRALLDGLEEGREFDERAPHEYLLGGGIRRRPGKSPGLTENRVGETRKVRDLKGERRGRRELLRHHALAGNGFLFGDDEKNAAPCGNTDFDGFGDLRGLAAAGIAENECQHSVSPPSRYPRPREENMRFTPSLSILRRR